MKKIVICGGHLTPALALIESLKDNKDYQLIFFGRKTATEGIKNPSVEFKTIKSLGVPFVSITAGRLQRKFTRFTLMSWAKIPIGLIQSLYYLLKFRPNIIISFGGYISTPVIFSGWMLAIDSISHEQAVIPGLATKINSLFSKKVYLTWQMTQKYFNGEKFEVIGNLTRRTLFKKKAKDFKINQFLKKPQKLIFITGGNQGSHFLNQITYQLLPKLKNYSVIHQVGATNWQGDLDQAKKIKNSNYLMREYFGPQDIGAILNKADLIISRSGANIIWDLALLGKVAILIPLPISAGGEQEANARILEQAGSARILLQKDLKPEDLLSSINQIVHNLSNYQIKANVFSKTLSKDALTLFKKSL